MNINNLSFQKDKIKDINSFFSSPNESKIFLTIHLEKGDTEKLNINKNTNPEKLAYNFCLKHNLEFTSVKELITKIKNFKENNFIAEKENLESTNIKNNKSALPLGNYIININNNNKKSLINYSSNTINLKEIQNNKKSQDNNFKNNNILSNSNITPINSGSNISRNNLVYTSSDDKNLNIFEFGTSKKENDDKLTDNNNNPNINFFNDSNKNKYEYIINKKSKDNISNNSNNIYIFNESFNNKINNLEKAYSNLNPNNKKSDSIKKNIKKENIDTAREIISQTIKNCLKSLEKEENIDVTISENNNNSFLKKENKTISDENNNSENTEKKIDFIMQNDELFSLKNIYLIPKAKKISIFNNEDLCKDNKIDIYITNPKINNNIQNKNPFECINANNEKKEDNNKKNFKESIFKEKEENLFHENEIKINNLEENNNLINMPINNTDNNKNTFNFDNLNKYLNRNDNNLNLYNYKTNYCMNNYSKDNDINIKIGDNNIIQNEIKFSLLPKKKYIPLSYSHKGFNMKKFRKVIKRDLIKFRSYHESKKKIGWEKNNNSIKSNCNNCFSNNNMSKISLINDNIIKNKRNTSSLKIIINNDNENKIFNTSKEDQSFNKSYPLSYTKSEKSMASLKNKNSKNQDYYNIRTTTTSLGNHTNYYSSTSRVSRDSTNKKKCKNKKLNKLNNMNKIPLNPIFNSSNEFLLKRQKEKENNTYYNNTKTIANNSQKLFCTSLSYNNKIYNSPDYLSQRTKSNIANDYKIHSIIKLVKKTNNNPNVNNLAQNLMIKKEIINSLKNIFNFITKNNRILDAFAIVNRKIIPNEIYSIIKKIVNHCNKSKRFIEYDEFINKAIDLFELFSMEEKITILNFN